MHTIQDDIVLQLKIALCTPPDADVVRMNELIARRKASVISKDELEELILLTDKAKCLNIERMRYLTQLATLRNITLNELIHQFGLRPLD